MTGTNVTGGVTGMNAAHLAVKADGGGARQDNVVTSRIVVRAHGRVSLDTAASV